MSQPTLDFWFEFASTYSYLSAMRIEDEAEKRGVSVNWCPFLLGPIFASQGWNTSPFSIYPVKGKYMWRDMERGTEKYGLPFNRPDASDPRAFPQHSVLAARMALVALEQPEGKAFCRAVYTAEFAEARDISDESTLVAIAKDVGCPSDLHQQAIAPENKLLLRSNTEEAIGLGIFGAPSFAVGGELFWGDDRLEDALDWAQTHAG